MSPLINKERPSDSSVLLIKFSARRSLSVWSRVTSHLNAPHFALVSHKINQFRSSQKNYKIKIYPLFLHCTVNVLSDFRVLKLESIYKSYDWMGETGSYILSYGEQLSLTRPPWRLEEREEERMQPRKCIQNMEPSTFKIFTLSSNWSRTYSTCSKTSHQFKLQLSIERKFSSSIYSSPKIEF